MGKKDSKSDKLFKGIGFGGKILGGVVSVATGVYDLIKIIRNHPEWYTHYETSNLVALNLAAKQNVVYEQTQEADNIETGSFTFTSAAMPAVAAVMVLLTLPHGDNEGWRTGIRLLYQQLRTANAGKVNFTMQDLEKYVFNVRQLRAINAYLKRLYNMTYTFVSTNSGIPQQLIHACRVDFKDIMANAADLLMYQQRFAQECEVSFPLNCDLFRRAEWMFGNIFCDSNTQKPSWYVPTFEPIHSQERLELNGIQYFIGTSNEEWDVDTTGPLFNQLCTFSELKSWCDKIKNSCINDARMSIIAGDIIKAFGDRSFEKWPVAAIDEGVSAIYDEDALSQYQNANVINTRRATIYAVANNVATFDGLTKSNVEYALSTEGKDEWEDATINVGWNMSLLGVSDPSQTNYISVNDNARPFITDRINNYLVNWHSDKIDSGHVLSITRLIPTGATMFEQGNTLYLNYNTFGTEVITEVFAVSQFTRDSDLNAQLNAVPLLTPFAGSLSYHIGESMNYMTFAYFLWANYDWAPRVRFIGITDSGLARNYGEQSMDMLDWDVFARIDSMSMATYFSYGDQSLLYAGKSQNQSNTAVYGKREGGKSSKPIHVKPQPSDKK